jgi:hypothetical protein
MYLYTGGDEMTDLKLCPYCGVLPKSWTHTFMDGESVTYVCCSNEACPFEGRTMRLEKWQSRPLEDALTHRIEELEAFVIMFWRETTMNAEAHGHLFITIPTCRLRLMDY